MERHHCRRKYPRTRRPPFTFFNLPLELQLHVLHFLDLETLHTIVYSSPHAMNLYSSYPEYVLFGSTGQTGLQIQNLILTTFDIIQSIQSDNPTRGPQPEDMGKYWRDNLDTETPRSILQTSKSATGAALATLHHLCALQAEVHNLVEAYAQDDYTRSCHADNPGAVPDPLHLSSTEYNRISRAVWRLKLFGTVFYNYTDTFKLTDLFNENAAFSGYIGRLAEFELDEMLTVYAFMARRQRHFKWCIPHKGCPGRKVGKLNLDPFECKVCEVGYAFDFGLHNLQTFWWCVDMFFLENGTTWPREGACRQEPIKVWRDGEGEDMASEGWWLYYSARKNSNMTPEDYKFVFRNRGMFFWDKERLRKWDFSQEIKELFW